MLSPYSCLVLASFVIQAHRCIWIVLSGAISQSMSKNFLPFSPLFRHTGSSGCSECPIGHHCPTEKLVYPIPCQVGKYQPQKTQTSCLECPEGRSSLLCFLGQNNHECIQTEVLGYSLICSLIRSRCSLVRLLAHVAHSLAHGTVIDWMAIYSVFFSLLAHSASQDEENSK